VSSPSSALADADRAELLDLAVQVVLSGIERRPIAGVAVPTSPALGVLGASFVTLERGEQLLGCIGTIEAVRPLYEDVMQNAYRSAFQDPRLPPVDAGDYAVMSVKVSVLTPLAPMPAGSRAELLGWLRPGTDGLLIADRLRRATFLPSVWPKVASPDEFVDLLLAKAGFDRGGWPAKLKAWRYTTDEFADPGPRAPL
jgi:AmmeMemoRadiSam system protein A